MKVVLVATYEQGHQPFGLASPKSWLEREGHAVTCCDLSVIKLDLAAVRAADLVAFHLPMHTAARLALPVIEQVKQVNRSARLAAYGLYAPLNSAHLSHLGVHAIAGGEYEAALSAIARGDAVPEVSRERLCFITPDRTDLPALGAYAQLRTADGSHATAGYTIASRGCKHTCRHCPIVPVYQGQFRVISHEVVLEDIRRQVEAGARHITFGDPDFLNGPRHAMRIVEGLHHEFPALSYDCTIKIEHLKKHRNLMGALKDTGCLFITSAVESLDDGVLELLRKNHTRRDFYDVAQWMREAGLILQPTFLAFTPWTTLESYRQMLQAIAELELVENTAPVQLALRLLVTWNSLLLELSEVKARVGPFDPVSLVYPWAHSDPRVDRLARDVFSLVSENLGRGRTEIFAEVWERAHARPLPENFRLLPRAAIPYLDEPWYC